MEVVIIVILAEYITGEEPFRGVFHDCLDLTKCSLSHVGHHILDLGRVVGNDVAEVSVDGEGSRGNALDVARLTDDFDADLVGNAVGPGTNLTGSVKCQCVLDLTGWIDVQAPFEEGGPAPAGVKNRLVAYKRDVSAINPNAIEAPRNTSQCLFCRDLSGNHHSEDCGPEGYLGANERLHLECFGCDSMPFLLFAK